MKTSKSKITINSFIAVTIICLGSCKKIESPENVAGTGGAKYESGIFISNEGAFGAGNGSISYFNTTAKSIKNSVFYIENGRPLGDVVQSITKVGDKAYICVNGSNKVEVVDATTFKEQTTISNLPLPRYMIANGTTGYVSSWNNSGEVAIIDLQNHSVTGTITVGSGPERMAINNNYLYVPNSGGYGLDSTVSVIDLSNNSIVTTIDIGAYNPSCIVNGIGNVVWILARGQIKYDGNWNVIGHDPSKLIKINTSNNTIESSTTLFATSHPATLDISPDKSTLYIGGSYGFTAIYSTSSTNPSSPSQLINESNYGFFVNQNTGNLFILQEASSSNGKLLRYSPSGTKLGEHTVGVFPNGGTSRRK